MGKRKNGVKVKFNKHNKWGSSPCCCEKGYPTKFGISTVFCWVCNRIRARKVFRTESFCKRFGWDKTCTTCQQFGDYHLFGSGEIKEVKKMFAVVTLRDVNNSYEGLGDVGLELFENEKSAEERLVEIYNHHKENLMADETELEVDSLDLEHKVFSIGRDGEYYSGQVRESRALK